VSEIKVLVNDNFAFTSDAVAIAIVLQHSHEERSIMHFTEEGFNRFDTAEPFVTANPTMVIPNDIARALLDALMRYYQGASDMHTVRADLLHERARVDKMIEATIGLADRSLALALGE